jgi:phosphate transport system substrate-binding protein
MAWRPTAQVLLAPLVQTATGMRRGRGSNRARIAAAAIAALSGVAVGCARSAERGMTLAGSTSLQPYVEQWAEAYRAGRPGGGAAIHIQGGGSTAGVQAVVSGAAEIGMSSRALTSAEAVAVEAIRVADDGMAIVVHPANPIVGLTLAEARAVYAGDVKRWPAPLGRHGAITVITREEGSGTRAAFEDLVMGGRRIVASALVQDSSGAVRQMVAGDPAAVGYLSLGLVDPSVKALRIDGVAPAEASIRDGTYPLVRPFLLILRRPRGGAPVARAREAAAFIAWITGPAGSDIARREGLVPPRQAEGDQ